MCVCVCVVWEGMVSGPTLSRKVMLPIVSNVKSQLMAKRLQLPWTIFVRGLPRLGLRKVLLLGQDAFHSRARLPRRDGRRGTLPMNSVVGLVAFLMTVAENGEVKWEQFCQFREVEPRKEFLLNSSRVSSPSTHTLTFTHTYTHMRNVK